MKSLEELYKSIERIRNNSIYGLPMCKLDDKTYEYCRNDALDTYRYLAEYMAVKPVTAKEMLEYSRRNNNMFDVNNNVYLVRWNKSNDNLNEGTITLLGKVRNASITESCAPYTTYASNSVYVPLAPMREIRLEADISAEYSDTSDFARVLTCLGGYAKMGIESAKTKAKGLIAWNTANKFEIKKVIFSGPCTIVFWADGTKTMVRVQGNDKLDREKGLAMAIAKKAYGNKGSYGNIFKRWLLGENWRKLERAAAKIAKMAKVDKASDEDLKKAIDKSKKIIEKSKKKSNKKR
ncbi:MAG: hypothetical protein J6U54_16075 [Clostridiales bacterium]|nr:hypothetical protein [Clostridiales bacterium]